MLDDLCWVAIDIGPFVKRQISGWDDGALTPCLAAPGLLFVGKQDR
jgi:hypothetical protein